MGYAISLVIPTLNRHAQLSATLDSLLHCDGTGFDDIEIIVVDDGSTEPVEKVIGEKTPEPPFRLRLLNQSHGGPAKARNLGFRSAANQTVIFIDDDVLASRNMLSMHVAAHDANPGCVIFGLYPYIRPEPETAVFRYLDMLESEPRLRLIAEADSEYIETNFLASGNLSVKKSELPFADGVYDESLQVPMSEEIELWDRLASLGVKTIFVPAIESLHTQPVSIEGACVQNYKYGLGIAEVASKRTLRLFNPTFAENLKVNGPVARGDSFGLIVKKCVKRVLGWTPCRFGLLKIVGIAESLAPSSDRFLFRLYRLTIGTFYFAGIRDGLRRFGGRG